MNVTVRHGCTSFDESLAVMIDNGKKIASKLEFAHFRNPFSISKMGVDIITYQ